MSVFQDLYKSSLAKNKYTNLVSLAHVSQMTKMFKLKNWEEVQYVYESVVSNRIAIVDLYDITDDKEYERIIGFLSGICMSFAIRLETLNPRQFILDPKNKSRGNFSFSEQSLIRL